MTETAGGGMMGGHGGFGGKENMKPEFEDMTPPNFGGMKPPENFGGERPFPKQ